MALTSDSTAAAEQFTALFTLLGLIAGYLAGTKTGDQDELAVERKPPRKPGPEGREPKPAPDRGPVGDEAADFTTAIIKSRSLL